MANLTESTNRFEAFLSRMTKSGSLKRRGFGCNTEMRPAQPRGSFTVRGLPGHLLKSRVVKSSLANELLF